MNDQEEYIDRYLNGALGEAERLSFLRRLEDDSEFREEFLRQENLTDMIRLAALREQLESIHLEMETGSLHPTPETISSDSSVAGKRPPIKKMATRWWLAAAAIIGLVILGDYLLTKHSQARVDSLYAAWYTPEPGLPTTMGAGQNNNGLMDAMVDYKTTEYTAAISKFKKTLSDPPHHADSVALFYLAASYMGAGQYDSAYLSFKRLAASPPVEGSADYVSKAQWYEALCCLRLKKIPEARSVLQTLSGSSVNPYREKAIKLAKELPAL